MSGERERWEIRRRAKVSVNNHQVEHLKTKWRGSWWTQWQECIFIFITLKVEGEAEIENSYLNSIFSLNYSNTAWICEHDYSCTTFLSLLCWGWGRWFLHRRFYPGLLLNLCSNSSQESKYCKSLKCLAWENTSHPSPPHLSSNPPPHHDLWPSHVPPTKLKQTIHKKTSGKKTAWKYES